jgi:hypothetical protein
VIRKAAPNGFDACWSSVGSDKFRDDGDGARDIFFFLSDRRDVRQRANRCLYPNRSPDHPRRRGLSGQTAAHGSEIASRAKRLIEICRPRLSR